MRLMRRWESAPIEVRIAFYAISDGTDTCFHPHLHSSRSHLSIDMIFAGWEYRE